MQKCQNNALKYLKDAYPLYDVEKFKTKLYPKHSKNIPDLSVLYEIDQKQIEKCFYFIGK